MSHYYILFISTVEEFLPRHDILQVRNERNHLALIQPGFVHPVYKIHSIYPICTTIAPKQERRLKILEFFVYRMIG